MPNIKTCDLIYIPANFILHFNNQSLSEETKMNVLKDMEAIFIVAVALSLSASAFAKPPVAAAPIITSSIQSIKVVVLGEGMSAAEKALPAAL